jgi:hypothetical protein
MSGYVYAETTQVRMAGPTANWYVTALGSYLAPSAHAQSALSMLQHSAESIAFNPEWLVWQKQLVSTATRRNLNAAAANAEATRQMNARQEKWKRRMAGETDNFNDILNGTTFTRDPTSGIEREVPTGPGGQKWIDNGENVVSVAMQPGSS